jgi:hypothetical protein
MPEPSQAAEKVTIRGHVQRTRSLAGAFVTMPSTSSTPTMDSRPNCLKPELQSTYFR